MVIEADPAAATRSRKVWPVDFRAIPTDFWKQIFPIKTAA